MKTILSCEYLREFSKKFDGPNGILRGLGETGSWKKPKVENLVTLSLKALKPIWKPWLKNFGKLSSYLTERQKKVFNSSVPI